MDVNRQYGLDLLRIMAMGVIFIGHSANQFSCNYWILSPLIELRSAAMSLFFMLSGYVIFLTYQNKNMCNFIEIKIFYIKRFASIVPIYYFISIMFIIFIGTDHFIDIIKLLPIELLGLQTTVSSLFGVSHNGGTWFVSCLLLCYLFYPYIQQLISKGSCKIKIVVAMLIIGFMIYIPSIISWFGLLSIYENPFYRGVEFILGCILSAIVSEHIMNCNQTSVKKLSNLGWFILALSSILFLVIRYSNAIVLGRMGYEILCYPLLSSMVVGGGLIDDRLFNKIKIIRIIITYMSSIAYEFFLAQFFVWKISGFFMAFFSLERNLYKIVISFFICLFLATILHYLIGKPISQLIKKFFIKPELGIGNK